MVRGTHIEVGRNSDNGMGDLLAQVRLGNVLHFTQNHGGNFLRGESLLSALDINLDDGLAVLGDNLVREVFEIGLDVFVTEFSANQTPKDDLLERKQCSN